MAAENDQKIKSLLDAIEKKRAKLGTKPKPVWTGNGNLKFGGEVANINTINSIDKCVHIASILMLEKGAHEKACEFLGVKPAEKDSAVDDMLTDLKLRVQIIQYDEEKKNLTAMEAKLKDLRSEDLKTADALADITSSLDG